MKATVTEQKRLLDLQQIDNALNTLRHRARSLPQDAHIRTLTAERDGHRIELARHVGAQEDIASEQAQLEADSAMVEQRLDRDRTRLAAGGSAKDAQALEAEIQSLVARRGVLDEVLLEVMERAEAAEARVTEARDVDGRLGEELTRAAAEREAELDRLNAETASNLGQRQALADLVDADLLALYEQRRARGGIGAALLRQRACGGCTITLTGADLEEVRRAPADEVVQCPECSCILVRTEESGIW
ncbi:zinc ribbon domain-containing protein [Mycetocola reblochoni]|uniref:zinc ribbon domain-containing protein n=1 Tax=Mycetocola reblochoni TaxID=331618 RepID=UPI003F97EDF3